MGEKSKAIDNRTDESKLDSAKASGRKVDVRPAEECEVMVERGAVISRVDWTRLALISLPPPSGELSHEAGPRSLESVHPTPKIRGTANV